jgi:hypothetical protein
MQHVICDTNIWYNIANEKISEEQLEGVKLYATSVNITEISSSPNLVKDIDLVVRTIKAMKKYAFRVIIENPLEYLISSFFHEFNPDSKTELGLLKGFDTLVSMDVNGISKKTINKAKNQIDQIVQPQIEEANKMNDDLIIIRKKIKKTEGKQKHRSNNYINTWKEYFSKLVLEYSKLHCDKEYLLNTNEKSWEQFEFFLYTWEHYFKNNLEIGNWKFDKNDWGDLFNLIYIKDEFKYWTIERKWNVIFNSNNKLKKYNYGT